uniref:Uncharacterized protein n=1 Tax=Knipowitschia caucasica TaxID=637954 RepID=A0AAV2K7Q2_KNICA
MGLISPGSHFSGFKLRCSCEEKRYLNKIYSGKELLEDGCNTLQTNGFVTDSSSYPHQQIFDDAHVINGNILQMFSDPVSSSQLTALVFSQNKLCATTGTM